MPKPTFFQTPEDFRRWLEAHHRKKQELLVGLYKKGSGRPSITWRDAVDQALCFGWIDGVGKRLDDVSYCIRFTPRRPRSHWSAVNIARVKALKREGLMRPAGLKAFEARAVGRRAPYPHEQREQAALDGEQSRLFRANPKAWSFFQAQAPWYQRTALFWVVSAKKPETKSRRLTKLIEDSAAGKTLAQFTRPTHRA